MDKVQKIREEIEIVVSRRLNLLNGDYFDLNEEIEGFTNEIMDIIDSMQKEPVSDSETVETQNKEVYMKPHSEPIYLGIGGIPIDAPKYLCKEEPKKCIFAEDSYTDEDRKVLCDGCEEECKLKTSKPYD